jgi:serine/threonine protein kinase
VQLADVGVAGFLKISDLLTTCSGCPWFAAPEIIRGTDAAVEMDLWTIGALTYFLLAGALPFAAETPFQQYQSIVAASVEFGPEFEEISDAAKGFIRALLVGDPKGPLAAKHAWFAELEERGPGVLLSRENILAELQKKREFKKYEPRPIEEAEEPAAYAGEGDAQ